MTILLIFFNFSEIILEDGLYKVILIIFACICMLDAAPFYLFLPCRFERYVSEKKIVVISRIRSCIGITQICTEYQSLLFIELWLGDGGIRGIRVGYGSVMFMVRVWGDRKDIW